MPLARGDKEYRLPVSGLNTEANILDFPQDYAVDINNMLIDFDPMRLKPRLGHAVFSDKLSNFGGITIDTGPHGVSYFLWESVGGDPDFNYLVFQQGQGLIFKRTDLISGVRYGNSGGNFFDFLGLSSQTSKGTQAIVQSTPLQYSKVKGHMLITAEGINPTLFRVNSDGDLEIAELTISVRDTIGLESGIAVDKRPTVLADFPDPKTASATTGLTDLSEKHEYNLYNQGWYQRRRLSGGSKVVSDPIVEFEAENSEFPSNADISFIGMVDSSGDLIFDAEFLKDQTFGSTPAARGHYVVNAFDMDRETPRTSPEDSGAFTGGGGSNGGTDGTWQSTFVGPIP